jgi:hypothetical protein
LFKYLIYTFAVVIDNKSIMASAIQDTPILQGEDARRFRQHLRDTLFRTLTPAEQKAKKERLERMKRNYESMQASFRGPGTF